MKSLHMRNCLAPLFAAAIGLAAGFAAPAAAQPLADMLDRLPAAEALRHLHQPGRIQRHWQGPRPWWDDRHGDRDRHDFRHRRETDYERQMRGLYRPGYDIDRVLRNQYHGNRQ